MTAKRPSYEDDPFTFNFNRLEDAFKYVEVDVNDLVDVDSEIDSDRLDELRVIAHRLADRLDALAALAALRCDWCGEVSGVSGGRSTRRYCSDRCRQAAHRDRRRQSQ